eukprot:Skav231750  [mRNA]  locus=scaffold695:21020:21403:- [translate_table: standard]
MLYLPISLSLDMIDLPPRPNDAFSPETKWFPTKDGHSFLTKRAQAWQACVRILAKLLGYELKILKYENPCDFDATIQGFDQEVEQQVETEPQKFLVLVTNLPATCRGSFFAGHHRMILCYNTDGDSQ